MSVDTDGQICFGVLLEEGIELPWDSHGNDMESWWLEVVLEDKPSFELFNEQGGWIDGKEPARELIDQYLDEQRKFWNSHPKIPIEIFNGQSGDYPLYILAVKGSTLIASRGSPESFDPLQLVVSDEQVKELTDFCKRFGIVYENPPQWYLSSYWG